MLALKGPMVVHKLRWLALDVILKGWEEREGDFSWILFGFPITPQTYNRACFTILSLASLVLGVFVRAAW